jgi:hypothetical protein
MSPYDPKRAFLTAPHMSAKKNQVEKTRRILKEMNERAERATDEQTARSDN